MEDVLLRMVLLRMVLLRMWLVLCVRMCVRVCASSCTFFLFELKDETDAMNFVDYNATDMYSTINWTRRSNGWCKNELKQNEDWGTTALKI